MPRVELNIDVTDAAGLGEPASIAITVQAPGADQLPAEPVVCFAKAGGGYSRGYYTCDLPGPAKGAQSDWHVARGWIFAAVDHLGTGGSSLHDGPRMDFSTLAAAAQAAEAEVLRRLAAGDLFEGYPKVTAPLKIGIGQSMGGCMTVVQQGRHHPYDGIAILGYSAVHTHPPTKPGTEPLVAAWLARDSLLEDPLLLLNTAQIAAVGGVSRDRGGSGDRMAWAFHYDDVDASVYGPDLERFNRNITDPETQKGHTCPPWGSLSVPGAVSRASLTPGIIAVEAAAVRCPVLCAMGERDVCADPKGEPRAYLSSRSVDLYVCPRMSHMHNFASTRELFWRRIELLADWARVVKAAGG